MNLVFQNDVREVATIDITADDRRNLSTVVQFLRADLDFVRANGGEFYRKILDAIPFSGKFKHVSIDTRVHMLMPKMYPCIPGWHCDDFYRPDGKQPDLVNLPPAKHYVVVVDAGTESLTQFQATPFMLPDPASLDNPNGDPIYGIYHRLIEELGREKITCKDDTVYSFGPLAFHQGMPAKGRGFRLFFRATESDHHAPLNQIRQQTQVYLTEPFYGW